MLLATKNIFKNYSLSFGVPVNVNILNISLETKTNKNLCAGAKGFGPLPVVG